PTPPDRQSRVAPPRGGGGRVGGRGRARGPGPPPPGGGGAPPDPALARYADETCEALHGLGVVTVAVDTPVSPVRHATHRITLPPSDAALAPLATAVPLQLLAAGLARLSGLDPDTRAHLKSDATRFRVSRLLTRRSLVGTGH
ncbi:MAG: hypothetical protein LH632_15875, partial [Rhodoferax sp.]|nr:hypothetical protein [Rhodoferax sp.]